MDWTCTHRRNGRITQRTRSNDKHRRIGHVDQEKSTEEIFEHVIRGVRLSRLRELLRGRDEHHTRKEERDGGPSLGLKGSAYLGGAGVGEAGGLTGGVVPGAAGSGFCWVVTGGAGVPLTSDRGPRWPRIASTSAPSMKSTAHTVVIFVSNVAPPRR